MYRAIKYWFNCQKGVYIVMAVMVISIFGIVLSDVYFTTNWVKVFRTILILSLLFFSIFVDRDFGKSRMKSEYAVQIDTLKVLNESRKIVEGLIVHESCENDVRKLHENLGRLIAITLNN